MNSKVTRPHAFFRRYWLWAALILTSVLLFAALRLTSENPSLADSRRMFRDGSEPISERPREPPVPGRDQPFSLPEPVMPVEIQTVRGRAYAEAVKTGAPHPAEVAFRRSVDAFLDHNQSFVIEQANAENLSLEEVRELTHFGVWVKETQRWSEVEQVLGQPLTEEARTAAEELLHQLNTEFKTSMRALVKSRATEDARWALIRETRERYRSAYFEITGMNRPLLQDLLAGDLRRKYAATVTEPPENKEPPPESQGSESKERPEAAPDDVDIRD